MFYMQWLLVLDSGAGSVPLKRTFPTWFLVLEDNCALHPRDICQSLWAQWFDGNIRTLSHAFEADKGKLTGQVIIQASTFSLQSGSDFDHLKELRESRPYVCFPFRFVEKLCKPSRRNVLQCSSMQTWLECKPEEDWRFPIFYSLP